MFVIRTFVNNGIGHGRCQTNGCLCFVQKALKAETHGGHVEFGVSLIASYYVIHAISNWCNFSDNFMHYCVKQKLCVSFKTLSKFA